MLWDGAWQSHALDPNGQPAKLPRMGDYVPSFPSSVSSNCGAPLLQPQPVLGQAAMQMPLAAGAGFAGFGFAAPPAPPVIASSPAFAQPCGGSSAAPSGNAMTRTIFDALQNHSRSSAPSPAVASAPAPVQAFTPSAAAPVAAGDPGLGSMLLDSLRSLGGDALGAIQSSNEGQELLRQVQGMRPASQLMAVKQEVHTMAVKQELHQPPTASAPQFMAVKQESPFAVAPTPAPQPAPVSAPAPAPAPQFMVVKEEVQEEADSTAVKEEPVGVADAVVKEELAAPEPVPASAPPDPAATPASAPAPASSSSGAVHRPSPPAVEQGVESDSDEDVPHRLPPGFGAIPEDIIEERARAREEMRILQLKATQPCRFGRRCKKRDCPNLHAEGRDIDTAWNPCAFGRRCKRKGCFYDHPEGRIVDDNPDKGMCKFGARCTRPDCLYDHPEGREVPGSADSRICFFCHEPGHLAADCKLNPESWNFSRDHGKVLVATPLKALTN